MSSLGPIEAPSRLMELVCDYMDNVIRGMFIVLFGPVLLAALIVLSPLFLVGFVYDCLRADLLRKWLTQKS